MKRCLACASVWLLAVGCGSSSDPNAGMMNKGGANGMAGSPTGQAGGGSANVAGTGPAAGGTANSAGGSAVGGAGSGSVAGSAGSVGGGSTGSAGSAGSSGGSGNAGGSGGAGGGSAAYKCPAGPFTFTPPSGMASKVAGAPPSDSFNKDAWTNVEGPVWIGDALYFSEMTNSNMRPPSRILKIASGTVSVFAADAGSNGLAVDGNGNLIAAVHKDGSISQLSLTDGAATPLVSMYMNKRFTSPNDLAIRSDGTIYFSDPSYQNSANPQGAERLYRVTPAPTRTVSAIADAPTPPNGVTLSPDEKTLYVSANNAGLKKFTVMADGSLSAASDFVAGSGGDGMAVDCAGDLFVAGNGASNVRVYSPAGALLTTIALASGAGNTTNVAFGGADHKTLYITAQGTEGQRGVYSIAVSVPGFPY
ncbi:MAG TPA: SMP-30/gluconolactonase/LRE family protein [Polyangiaceae bacterium]|nr:SMP-30/gluconolactonase/LRE family protein [Polyangiaceae bacterium]